MLSDYFHTAVTIPAEVHTLPQNRLRCGRGRVAHWYRLQATVRGPAGSVRHWRPSMRIVGSETSSCTTGATRVVGPAAGSRCRIFRAP
mgnify:CR=1 FL=1